MTSSFDKTLRQTIEVAEDGRGNTYYLDRHMVGDKTRYTVSRDEYVLRWFSEEPDAVSYFKEQTQSKNR